MITYHEDYLEVIFCRALCVDSVILVITFLIFVGYSTAIMMKRSLQVNLLIDGRSWNELVRDDCSNKQLYIRIDRKGESECDTFMFDS